NLDGDDRVVAPDLRLVEDLRRENRHSIIERVPLVNGDRSPGVEDVHQHLSHHRLRNDSVRGAGVADGEVVLADALALGVELLLDAVAVERRQTRIAQARRVLGNEPLVFAVRLEYENGMAE